MCVETWVVKLGGSLLETRALLDWIKVLAEVSTKITHRVILVPGGGVFADQVRGLQRTYGFDERTAHEMAILATQQMGLLISGIQPGLKIIAADMNPLQCHGSGVWIWLPQVALLDAWGLGVGWDYTSDSIAACLAQNVRAAHLFLIKTQPEYEASVVIAERLISQGMIDPGTGDILCRSPVKAWMYDSRRLSDFAKTLSNHAAVGFGGSEIYFEGISEV